MRAANYYIFSIKYSAGLFKEFLLLRKKLKEEGYYTKLFISTHYKIQNKTEIDPVRYLGNSKSISQILKDCLFFPILWRKISRDIRNAPKAQQQFALFYNSHPINLPIQLFLKLFCNNFQIITFLHEPYVSKEERKKFGLVRAYYIGLILWIQLQSVKLSDKVVTLSSNGKILFQKHFETHKHKLIEASILFENPMPTPKVKRTYFSMIGTMNKNKALGDFFKTINYAIENKMDHLQFLVITSSNINEELSLLATGWEGYLKLINKNYITDDEIIEAILSSKAVAVIHTTASQSGVLPMACTYKTPVVCRNITAFTQFIKQEELVLSYNFEPKEMVNTFEEIASDFDKYQQIAENIFMNNFSEDNFGKIYQSIL